MAYFLEPYDSTAKRRAVMDSNHIPVAWIDYDDCPKEEADAIAEKVILGLNGVILDGLSNAVLVEQIERRARVGSPVTLQCPECTRRDAVLVGLCADHGEFTLPARNRMLWRFGTGLREIRREMESCGVTETEVAEYMAIAEGGMER